MKKRSFKIKNGSSEVVVYLFLEEVNYLVNKSEFIGQLIKSINLEHVGYAGFKSKKFFKEYLERQIERDNWIKGKYPMENLEEKELLEAIKKVFYKIEEVIPSEDIYVYVFPTLSEFVIKSMGGVGGFSSWKNTILLDVYPTNNWKKQFEIMLAHEVAHAVSPFCHKLSNLRSWLVFEGIAEHFRERFIGGKKSPWTSAISRRDSKKIFDELIPLLDSDNQDIYTGLFFGSKKYPLWAGYTIAYYLIEDYLKNLKEVDWKKVLMVHPNDVPVEKLFFAYSK